MNSIEFCAGAGGQALGLEQAGFAHNALVEIDSDCAATLRLNRPQWDVRCDDMNGFDGGSFAGTDLFGPEFGGDATGCEVLSGTLSRDSAHFHYA